MSGIRFDTSFSRSLKKFVKKDQHKVVALKKALRLFQQNPSHPSLHMEKLSGVDIWTIRVDRGNRIFFVWSDDGDIAIFFFVGSHDSYRTFGK